MQHFTFGVKKTLGTAVNLKVFGMNERGRDVLLGSAVLQIEELTPEATVRDKERGKRFRVGVTTLIDAVLWLQTTHKLTLVDATGAVRAALLFLSFFLSPLFVLCFGLFL